ncbi:hypothetical protein CEXT_428241 [Caerostris extrusa]|uniref:Dehydrogenase/reductase SDR family member 11 n=1 Tax=Caerostris extrusa TaxID=172846 RepID=A0AAV4Q0A6_CAEEX|nr:hypothetical protein CEXT_428241 [Caerostris extrusa]
MAHWKGKVALVTGASSGIGAGVCGALVKLGMVVVGCARRPDRINSLSKKIAAENVSGKLVGVRCDLTRENDILETFDYIKRKYNRLDVCINSAGLSHDSPLLSGSTQYFKNMLETNILALTVCNREAFKLMHETKEMGQIINMNSLSGHVLPNTSWTGVHFYCGTKFMVRALTECIRKEIKAQKSPIRIACVSPGVVRTEFYDNYLKDDPNLKTSDIFSDVRTLQPENIVDCILYILNAPPHVEIHDIIIRSIIDP